MKPLSILLVVALFTLPGNAQERVDTTQKYTAIKWTVQSLLWPGNFIQFGVEHRIGKYAGEVQAGISLPLKYDITDTINNPPGSLAGTYSGFTVRMEGRRYGKPKLKYRNANLFTGIELFYTQYQAYRGGSYVDTGKTIEPYSDKYLLNKSMFGAALKVGLQQRFAKHFLIEFYAGLGVKIKTVRQQGMFNVDHQSTKIDFNFGEPLLGTNATLAAPLSFCIGYYF